MRTSLKNAFYANWKRFATNDIFAFDFVSFLWKNNLCFFSLFSVLFFVLKRNRFALVKIPSFFSFSFSRYGSAESGRHITRQWHIIFAKSSRWPFAWTNSKHLQPLSLSGSGSSGKLWVEYRRYGLSTLVNCWIFTFPVKKNEENIQTHTHTRAEPNDGKMQFIALAVIS